MRANVGRLSYTLRPHHSLQSRHRGQSYLPSIRPHCRSCRRETTASDTCGTSSRLEGSPIATGCLYCIRHHEKTCCMEMHFRASLYSHASILGPYKAACLHARRAIGCREINPSRGTLPCPDTHNIHAVGFSARAISIALSFNAARRIDFDGKRRGDNSHPPRATWYHH